MTFITKLQVALCVLVLSACATESGPTPEERQKIEADIEAILTQPMDDEAYGEALQCLSTFEYERVEVLDDQRVLFHGRGDKVWLNTLRNRCVGLRPRHTLEFKLRNNRVCDLDQFFAIEGRVSGFDRVSGGCVLGKFQLVTPEQAEGIKAALQRE